MFDVEVTDIGAFDDGGRLCVRYGGQTVLDLDNQFLHHGIPQRKLTAVIPSTPGAARMMTAAEALIRRISITRAALLNLLSHPNIASKAAVVRIYDHEVQGGTVIKPLTGR